MEGFICICICAAPFVVALYGVLRWVKEAKWRKKMKLNSLMEKNCKDCTYRYLGTDYLNHCEIMEQIGVCSPSKLTCYHKK